MASIFPFRAWRSNSKVVKQVSCPPYDVVDTEEARILAKNNPQSFLHVIRPEIDFPADTAFNDDGVYEQGLKNLEQFIEEGLLIKESEPTLYLYQLSWENKIQTGFFGCVSVDEYDNEIILKHELTRPDKENDRTKHILKQHAHAEPVMLTYKDRPEHQKLTDEIVTKNQPIYDLEAPGNVTHKLWKIGDSGSINIHFKNIEKFYIADGHHRCKSASRAAHDLREEFPESNGTEAFNYFPAVVFPMSEMNILAYNRLVHRLPDYFMQQLDKRFDIKENVAPTPAKKGDISLYFDNTWIGLELPAFESPSSVEKLDVHRLQEFLLGPLIGINDQRQDENISFVGGIRGTKELENRVDSGSAELAISMYPTAIEELVAVSDEHKLMPPKSTWFEPKLRSGLLVHKF